MGNFVNESVGFLIGFQTKWDKFIEIFWEKNGYVKVLEGLQNTLTIAVCGLFIGIFIGTLIATVRVIPKYKRLPRVLNGICSFYVGLFRGTPMVVQLLVFYYVLLPLMGIFAGGGCLSWMAMRARRTGKRRHARRKPRGKRR